MRNDECDYFEGDINDWKQDSNASKVCENDRSNGEKYAEGNSSILQTSFNVLNLIQGKLFIIDIC